MPTLMSRCKLLPLLFYFQPTDLLKNINIFSAHQFIVLISLQSSLAIYDNINEKKKRSQEPKAHTKLIIFMCWKLEYITRLKQKLNKKQKKLLKKCTHKHQKRSNTRDDLPDPDDSRKFGKHLFCFTQSTMPSAVGCTIILCAPKIERKKSN